MKIRLNKFLSQSGIASRREADRLIEEGRIKVNGLVVTTLGTKIEVESDKVYVDGKRVKKKSLSIWIMINKPVGCIVSLRDPHHSNTIMDLLPAFETRIFPIGRLDKESEGLLLLTNDGELANRLMHPRFEIKKEYQVEIKGRFERTGLKGLERGIVLDGRKTAPARVKLVTVSDKRTTLRIEIHEGRKREIRRMLASLGHRVISLKRIRYAGLSLKGLKPGSWRHLSQKEYEHLRSLVGLRNGLPS